MRNQPLLLTLCAIGLILHVSPCPASPLQKVRVLNAGVPGQNSREGRERFDRDVLQQHPRIVLLYFGMNDAVNDKKMLAPEDFVGNMAWMVEAARAAGIVPVLSTIQHVDARRVLERHPPSAYGPEGPNGRIDRCNTLLRVMAKQQKVTLVDFSTALDHVGGPTPAMSPDGVHLGQTGYRLLAETFYRAVRRIARPGMVVVALGDSLTYGTPLRTADRPSSDTYPAVLESLLNDRAESP